MTRKPTPKQIGYARFLEKQAGVEGKLLEDMTFGSMQSYIRELQKKEPVMHKGSCSSVKETGDCDCM